MNTLKICLWGLFLFFYGGLMAKQPSNQWVTVKSESMGLQIDFPQYPLEMTFELPFQNTPATGQLHIYSAPISNGVFVLSTFLSPNVNLDLLQEKDFYHFFEKTLVPYFFFDPLVFRNKQSFHYHLISLKGTDKAAHFQFTYQDHATLKKLEGITILKDQKMHIYFYLANEEKFDQELLQRFLDSVQILKS